MFSIKQLIPSEVCLACNGCCRFASDDPPWPPHNIRPIPSKKDNNFLCPHLDAADNKCKIYKTRPFECSLYPFLINRDSVSGKVFLAVHLNCPFAAKNLKNNDFKEYAQYLTAFLKGSDFLKILENNSQIVQSYSDILNLAEIPYEIK